MVEVLTAVTALVSVVVSGILTIVSFRSASLAARRQHAVEMALAILPRRLDAVEGVWMSLFEKEAGGTLRQERIDGLIRSSVWFPSGLRERVLALLASPGLPDAQEFAAVRLAMMDIAGVSMMDQIRKDSEELVKTRGR